MTANKIFIKVRAIRSNNGGEYTGKELGDYLKNEGIDHQFTVPYSSLRTVLRSENTVL